MMIRHYRHSDFDVISSWWIAQGEPAPGVGMMIPDGTFVLEMNGEPIMSLTAFLTLSSIGYLEGYIAQPGLEKWLSNSGGRMLWDHCFEFLRQGNCKTVICYCDEESLVKRYEELGMTKVLDNVTCLAREL